MLKQILGFITLFLLFACSSQPPANKPPCISDQTYSSITEESINQIYVEARVCMEAKDLRSLSTLMHEDYFKSYDKVGYLGYRYPIQDKVTYFRGIAPHVRDATEIKIDLQIRSIEIDESGKFAVVIVSSTSKRKTRGKYWEYYSLQKNKHVLENGKPVVLSSEVLEYETIQ